MINSNGKKRILIVDDEPQIGKIFGLKLKLAGFDVLTTTNGADGIEIIRNDKPDIVLLDILMPGITGFEVLERVRKFSGVPIVVFTARPEITRMAIQLGANDSITKPIDPDRLVEKLSQLIDEFANTKTDPVS